LVARRCRVHSLSPFSDVFLMFHLLPLIAYYSSSPSMFSRSKSFVWLNFCNKLCGGGKGRKSHSPSSSFFYSFVSSVSYFELTKLTTSNPSITFAQSAQK
jgi:hypothetical protein